MQNFRFLKSMIRNFKGAWVRFLVILVFQEKLMFIFGFFFCFSWTFNKYRVSRLGWKYRLPTEGQTGIRSLRINDRLIYFNFKNITSYDATEILHELPSFLVTPHRDWPVSVYFFEFEPELCSAITRFSSKFWQISYLRKRTPRLVHSSGGGQIFSLNFY